MRRLIAGAVLAGFVIGACGRGDPLPASAELTGTITQDRVDRAVLALCELRGEADRRAAEGTFYDLAHQTLHDVAAAAEEVDRGAAAVLLATKQRVEADLAEVALPAGFGADVDVLLAATRSALEVIEVGHPGCPA